jgi:prepilin-type N-terminal cleavage/methylation domain-containing protein
MTRKQAQAGFTLIEVMIASVASMAVIAPAIAVMFNAFNWYAEIQSQIQLNREARQAFDLIGSGAKGGSNGNDSTPYLYGVRGRKLAPLGPLRTNYRLQYQSNNLTVSGDTMAGMTLTCTGVAAPLPDCASAGEAKTVTGWIGSDPSLNAATRSVVGRTVEMTITVSNPYQLQRTTNPASASEIYRTIYALNRDVADP